MQVAESEEFAQLPLNQLVELISSDELNICSEEQVFSAVMHWVRKRPHERAPLLSQVAFNQFRCCFMSLNMQVMQHIRLPLVNPKFLIGTVGNDPLIKCALKHYCL